MRLTPYEDQEQAIQQMVNNPTKAALLSSEIGSGKTLSAVETLLRLNAQVSLIICPLGTRVGWERTLKGQGWDGPVVRIDSSKAGKEAYAAALRGDRGVYLVGREYFLRPDWSKIKWDFVAYDEVHKASNRDSAGAKKLKTLKTKYKMAISATFYGNKFINSWTVARWLWGSPTIDPARSRWVAEWCRTEYSPFTAVNVVGEKVPGAFVKSLPCYIQLEAKVVDENGKEIEEPLELKRHVELTPSQRKTYDKLQQDMVVWLDENPLVVELPVILRTRLRQATLGELSFDENGEINFAPDCKSSKLDALKEILEDMEDEPVLILTDSKRFARVVVQRIKDAAAWTGDTSQEDREALLKTFGRKGGPQYLVATIAALGEGVDMLQKVCNTVVWLSRSDDQVMNQQVLGRLHRTGQMKRVRSIDLVALDTYDDGQINGLLRQKLEMRATLKKEEVR